MVASFHNCLSHVELKELKISPMEETKGYTGNFPCVKPIFVGGTTSMSEAANTVAKGRTLEEEVADIYRQFEGVRDVQGNVSIMGVQIDVLVTLETSDGTVMRYGIDAKNYDDNVPTPEVRKCITDFQMLRNAQEIDQGIIVAKAGFAKDAQAAALAAGVKLTVIKDLRRRVSGFTTYLENWVSRFEASEFVQQGTYIPLSAKTDEQQSVGKVEDYVLEWLKGDGTLITLLGNYGTGKSTTLREIMHRQALAHLANPATERIPIFVDLKRFRQAPTAQALITDLLVNQSDVQMNFRKFQEQNSQGRFLILFDGFDEMAEKVLDGMPLEHFNDLALLARDKAKVVISSRTHYFRDHEEVLRIHGGSETQLFQEVKHREGFQILQLDPFSRRDVETYLKRRFPNEWPDYRDLMERTYDLFSLAEVPILLSMIVQALPRIVEKQIPVNRSAIYRTFTDQWLYRDQWRRGLHVEERRFFCRNLALHFYKTQQYTVHWGDIPAFVKDYLRRRIENLDELDVFSTDVRTSNFLVRDEMGFYSFVHKSFMEFFVAEHFLEALRRREPDGLQDLRDQTKTPVIWEFLAEMMQESDVQELRRTVQRSSSRVTTTDLASNRLEADKWIHSKPISLGNAAALLILKGSSLEGANLEMARLDNVRATDVCFRKALLNGATFKNAVLKGVDFRDAILTLANFEWAALDQVDFARANMSEVDLRNAKMDKATIESIAKAKHWGSVKMHPHIKARVRTIYEQPTVSKAATVPDPEGTLDT